MKKVVLQENSKYHSVVRVIKKHPMVSCDDKEPTFSLLIPEAMLDGLASRLPKMIKRCREGNKPYLTLDFSGNIFIPNDASTIPVDEDEDSIDALLCA